ncbi:BZ3500_MvSof-1268-A1-R1_Chr6-2g08440 [Microbotryum saponariae]|uniref:BZ3500_MvSof-1268-A1-R1_Chr6-2g08440 protein n=1 Tax=Microbotryum saponariae TaxID=289078 RepID=A0A2X0NPI2_9BASI|nr:BZ3500_MvSof-1268-A1-R1_Chr6-2g08440 [Microbotryum saponariae]SDA07717.1 BZ3501_MvSof-1269-A2-R1_Chr6-1g08154 [Microbotryum saponariae]
MSLLSDLVHLRTIELSVSTRRCGCQMQSWAARAQQHQLQHGSPEGALSGAPRGRILQEEPACERAIPTSAPLAVRSQL